MKREDLALIIACLVLTAWHIVMLATNLRERRRPWVDATWIVLLLAGAYYFTQKALAR